MGQNQRKDYFRKYKQEHKEQRKEQFQVWYKKNKESVRNSNLIKAYGITLEGYNSLFNKQSGCCAICNKHQAELSQTLAVDHNHETGEIRGLLCHSCNLALGLFQDNTEYLTKAKAYLNGKTT